MKKVYKSSAKRLADFFESSRDKWKLRSHKNQTEKRKLENEIRDLRRSVSYWKNKYMESESKKKV